MDERTPPGDAGEVTADTVVIRQAGARTVNAREVSVRQGGVGVALSHDETTLQQAGAGVVMTRVARVSDSAIGFLIAREVQPNNVRVLFGVREALAFGAAAGLALALVLGLRRH